MKQNEQDFRAWCDKIHAAHPNIMYFTYKNKTLSFNACKIYGSTSHYPIFSIPCPDFGPDDLTYEVEPEYVWKVPEEGQINVKALYFYEWCWFKGIIIGWYLNRPIFFESEDCIQLAWLDKIVLADPENPDRKPDNNWRPE